MRLAQRQNDAAFAHLNDLDDIELYGNEGPLPAWMRSARVCERCGYDAVYDPQPHAVRCYGGKG